MCVTPAIQSWSWATHVCTNAPSPTQKPQPNANNLRGAPWQLPGDQPVHDGHPKSVASVRLSVKIARLCTISDASASARNLCSNVSAGAFESDGGSNSLHSGLESKAVSSSVAAADAGIACSFNAATRRCCSCVCLALVVTTTKSNRRNKASISMEGNAGDLAAGAAALRGI